MIATRLFDNRIASRQQAYLNGTPESFTFDALGNRASADGYTTNSLNQYTRQDFSVGTMSYYHTFGYDSDGNLTADTVFHPTSNGGTDMISSNGYTYDALNRLIATNTTSFTYDSQNRLTTSNEYVVESGWIFRQFAYDGWNMTGEFDAAGKLLESFTWDPSKAGGVGGLLAITTYNSDGSVAAVYVPFYNAHGDVMGLMDQASHTVVATYTYSAFGQITSKVWNGPTGTTDPNHFFWQTMYFDASTSLYWDKNRWYDPKLGRFITRDPSGEGSDPNLYRAFHNDPINHVDPDGMADGPTQDVREVIRKWNLGISRLKVQLEVMDFTRKLRDAAWDASVPKPADEGWLNRWVDGKMTDVRAYTDLVSDTGPAARLKYNYDRAIMSTELPRQEQQDQVMRNSNRAIDLAKSELLDSLCVIARDILDLEVTLAAMGVDGGDEELVANLFEEPVTGVRPLVSQVALGGRSMVAAPQTTAGAEFASSVYKTLRYASGELQAARMQGQIAYGSSDLSAMAAEFRQGAGISIERNISAFEFRTPNGLNTVMAASVRGTHAERIVGARVLELGIIPANVTRVYSELQPCSLPFNRCASYLQRTFPGADVTWSFEYGATTASREAGMAALRRAAETSRGQLDLFDH